MVEPIVLSTFGPRVGHENLPPQTTVFRLQGGGRVRASSRSGPVLADECLPAAAEEAAEDERDDHDVVELTGDRDEVRYEVERKREVAGERNKQQLLSPWDAGVAEQAAAEHDAVGDEASERASAFASAGEHEHQHERGVDEQERGDADKRPGPDAHVRTVASGCVRARPAPVFRPVRFVIGGGRACQVLQPWPARERKREACPSVRLRHSRTILWVLRQ